MTGTNMVRVLLPPSMHAIMLHDQPEIEVRSRIVVYILAEDVDDVYHPFKDFRSADRMVQARRKSDHQVIPLKKGACGTFEWASTHPPTATIADSTSLQSLCGESRQVRTKNISRRVSRWRLYKKRIPRPVSQGSPSRNTTLGLCCRPSLRVMQSGRHTRASSRRERRVQNHLRPSQTVHQRCRRCDGNRVESGRQDAPKIHLRLVARRLVGLRWSKSETYLLLQ